ncbi:MAG: FAD binding domain-containing protein [Candidatus Schekmanbacteria bacterium]|nr:FAD binding domain-containing protein [Candidatus Schekmanbacteria bacterium]
MKFTYIAPQSIDEVLDILSKEKGKAALLAGGTDLLLSVKDGDKQPDYIVDLKALRQFNQINDSSGRLRIGALTTVRDIEKSSLIGNKYPFLQQAAASLGSVQIRNLATIGGNIFNASPCADLALPLLALDATLTLQKSRASRKVSINSFFVDNGVSCAAADEVLLDIETEEKAGKGIFIKHSKRRAMDISVVGVCIRLEFSSDGKVADARIALGSVAPIPMRAIEAEESLTGELLNEKTIAESARIASDEAKPITDARASAWYRKDMVNALVRRGLTILKNGSGR